MSATELGNCRPVPSLPSRPERQPRALCAQGSRPPRRATSSSLQKTPPSPSPRSRLGCRRSWAASGSPNAQPSSFPERRRSEAVWSEAQREDKSRLASGSETERLVERRLPPKIGWTNAMELLMLGAHRRWRLISRCRLHANRFCQQPMLAAIWILHVIHAAVTLLSCFCCRLVPVVSLPSA